MNEEYTQEELDLLEEEQEDKLEDQSEDASFLNEELQAGLAPEPEEKFNQHAFLAKTAFTDDTTRVSFLTEPELGRPLFSVRFMKQMNNIAKHHLDNLLRSIGKNPNIDNKIANYFFDSSLNITDTGMSNKGFIQNMNVTRRMDSTRKKLKQNLKGGDDKSESK